MLVIVLNGPINAGKTVTGKALAAMLPGARFIDGDDHGAPEGTPFDTMLEIAFSRLEREIAGATEPVLVVAYPLRDEDFDRLDDHANMLCVDLLVVTLAPPMEAALTNRGTRDLLPGEVERSREMYAQGYADRDFSDLVITEMVSPEATARQICRHFDLPAGL
jgi:hypothetical protein